MCFLERPYSVSQSVTNTLFQKSPTIGLLHLKSIHPLWKILESYTTGVVSHQTVSRLLSSPNKQSGKYNKSDPILIGTAVSVISYTDFIVRVPSRQTYVGREWAQ